MGNQSSPHCEGEGAAVGAAWPGVSHPYLLAGHSPPSPKHVPCPSQRNPCSLTVPSLLQHAKGHLKVSQKELKDLQWEHEVLEQRFSKVRAAGGSGCPPHPVPLTEQGTQQRLCLAKGFPQL